ncbi:sarcosine oxidase subunit gamma [Amycolatopsis antarctica]|uniref:Sarcosine oxidase subunit gamma n=1 Tax=Amycolatopsis antarctica TaxID=1854586 RepID=A0A263D1Q6_9PSEU|nr:sarcosine oxidase subunit gamma family protein [Amycolatopsis antarctica]OZM72271.1 sarcosine oxidase subunit gamma [Amycolatopsis antarctica]
MTVESVLRHSPLGEVWGGEPAVLAPGTRAAERPYLTQLTVRVDDPAAVTGAGAAIGVPLPAAPCSFTSGTVAGQGIDVLWMGPDEYLVLAAPGLGAELTDALGEALAGRGSVVDVSAQRTTVTLSGPYARDVLAHGCAIDLHPSVSPSGTCVQTLLARAGIVLLVRGEDEFVLLVRASFARYLADWLADASVEYRALPD